MKIGIKIDDDHNDRMVMSKTVEAKMNLTASPSCTVISFSFHSQSAATKARKITCESTILALSCCHHICQWWKIMMFDQDKSCKSPHDPRLTSTPVPSLLDAQHWSPLIATSSSKFRFSSNQSSVYVAAVFDFNHWKLQEMHCLQFSTEIRWDQFPKISVHPPHFWGMGISGRKISGLKSGIKDVCSTTDIIGCL